MLFRALRAGAGALRSAGWRALAIALLYLPALGLALSIGRFPAIAVFALIAVFTVDNIATFALVRLLGAHRPGGLPLPPGPSTAPAIPSPEEPAQRRRATVPLVGTADRSPLHATGHALRLARPALRLAAVQLLGLFAALLVLLAMAGTDITSDEPSRREALILVAASGPLVALIAAFIALAPQRIALEGDPRVLVAVAHSVRIARVYYGTLFAIAMVDPVVLIAQFAAGEGLVAVLTAAVVHTLLRLLLVAACTEVYLEGPRLDVPEGVGRRD